MSVCVGCCVVGAGFCWRDGAVRTLGVRKYSAALIMIVTFSAAASMESANMADLPNDVAHCPPVTANCMLRRRIGRPRKINSTLICQGPHFIRPLLVLRALNGWVAGWADLAGGGIRWLALRFISLFTVTSKIVIRRRFKLSKFLELWAKSVIINARPRCFLLTCVLVVALIRRNP